ncbi:MAG: hypothetical protein A2W99_06590 [Bacteroidetes bacterium GWF2_33_16]|nr:MAG: hypothetical protein A2X00_05860 [Bacteroidetes bacterium GWE2_32_14]OFY05000.1 MAG: hypothetical protein A2W99_06590 [Bacteroidetes bacterium GWF2_33_16]
MKKISRIICLVIFIIINYPFLAITQISIPDSIKILPSEKVVNFLIGRGEFLVTADSPSAENYFLMASRLSDSLKNKEKSTESLFALGKYYYKNFNYPKALESFSILNEKYKADLSEKMFADIQHYLGLTYIRFENYERALFYIQKALYYYETKNDKAEIAKIQRNLGNIYLLLNNESLALPEYQKALIIYRELNDEEGIAMCYNNLGMIFSKFGNLSKALEYFNQSLEIKKKLKNLSGYANTLGNIGDAYSNVSNFDKAIEYFNQALEIMVEINNPNGLSEIYNYLGEVCIKKGDFKTAFEFLNKGRIISEKNNLKQRLTVNYKLLSDAYYGIGDYKNAIDNYKTYSQIKDSIFEALSNQKLADYKLVYENLQIENEVIAQEKQIQRQKDQFLFIIIVLISTLIFIIILLWQNRTIRKKSSKIQNINRELDGRVQKKTTELRITQYSVDLAVDAIMWMKKDGRFFYVNNSACSLLGYTKSELEKMSVFDIVLEFTEDIWNEYWDQLKKNKSYVIQLYYRSKQGSDIPVETAFNFREFEGEEYNFTFSRNITERKIAEEKLKNAKERAERSDHLKSAFLANMSHEIRTPMNAITGFTNLLIDKDVSQPDKEEIAELIKLSSNDLLNLINDIIDISKIEADELSINKSLYYVNDILRDIYKLYEQDINLKNKPLVLKLALSHDSERIAIYTDYARFRQIMNNFLNNAIKFTDNGEITFGYNIISMGNRKLIKIFVKDTGIGIAEDNLDSIFNRFTKLNDDRKKLYKGTGLGLSISKKLVHMLGGDIGVESEQGVGSMFFIILPYQEISKSEAHLLKASTSKKSFDWSQKTILVVEDTSSNYMLIENFLKPTKINLIWAQNGKDAIQLFKEISRIDLVLMDIQLPGINGYEATKIIKAHNKNVPVIAQTAYALSGEKEYSMNEGCDDYISKPIKQETLMNLLSSYLEK